jgi:predicted secreted protein
MAEHQLSDDDNGAVIDARVGDVIELRLGETASGGYRWTFDDAGADAIEPLPPTYEFEAGKVGGTSIAHFRFIVKGGGKSAIRLEYKRPWELGEPALRDFEVVVVAR